MKKRTIVRATPTSAALALLVASIIVQADESNGPDQAKFGASQLEFFEQRIRPILVEHCYSCHSADANNVKGGLLLDSREGLDTGGDSGPALVAGKPNESLLLAAMRHESLEMPPDRKLPDSVLKDFEVWIQNGAADPRAGGVARRKRSIDIDQGREFWSFRPVIKPPVPSIDDGWALSEIDQFLAAARVQGRAKSADVSAIQNQLPDVTTGIAGDAPPHVLIRRLTFVLTGLPPTLDEQKIFAELWASDSEAAMETTVDRLLASRRFGERWGRHWLDVARYAESTGGGRSMMLPDAWRFRDYVIRSFNDDKPFDQLIREHLAGDLLPSSSDEQHDEQVTGVGYLMLGAINYEEQDKEQLRMDVVDEQIDSMGRTFLGMTLGCCRCHDHKFDPIPATDYYALAGIFRSTKSLIPGNVCGFVTAPLTVGFDKAAMDQWLAMDAELERQITSLKKGLANSGSRPGAPTRGELQGVVVDDSEAVLEGEWTFSMFQQPYVGKGYHHSAQPRTGISATYEATLPADGEYVIRMVINHDASRSDSIPVLITHADGDSLVTVSQKAKPPGDGVFAELGRFRFEQAQPARVVIKAAEAAPGFVIIDAVQFLPAALMPSLVTKSVASIPAGETTGTHELLKRLEDERKAHAKTKPEVPVAMCVEDEPQPADWHMHIRGEIRNLGPVVPRGFITVATPPSASATLAQQTSASTSGRRELADWVASPMNPLTARVYVNRVWRHVMGEGLVRTPDNLGETGERPSHPELLDFLAASFMEDDGWSTKKLIRRLCLSRTFRMSSSAPLSQPATDPDNRLFTRAFRRRLDAESVRDSLLAISRSLDESIHSGRTIAKLATYDNEYHHEMYPTNSRSVFVPFFRNTMLDLFEIFDGANPNLVSGMRARSTRPAQALYMLNSPFVMEQAKLAAQSFLASSAIDSASVDISIRNAWKICVCREPTLNESFAVQTVLAERQNVEEAWTEIFHALFASVDFRYLE
jgi:hypothetical protein